MWKQGSLTEPLIWKVPPRLCGQSHEHPWKRVLGVLQHKGTRRPQPQVLVFLSMAMTFNAERF